MNPYPYIHNPVVLTDEIYSRYGGYMLTTSQEMRQAAYVIAEAAMYEDLETPLIVTTFTGTYAYSPRLLLDHAYVRELVMVRFVDRKNEVYHSISGSNQTDMFLDDPDFGLMSLSYCYHGWYGCGPSRPEQVQVIYTAGLPSGTSYDPRLLMGLTKYANVQLNEMLGTGNEGTGDIGIQKYSNQEYSEERVGLLRTGYGSSAVANYVHKLVGPYRKRRHVGY